MPDKSLKILDFSTVFLGIAFDDLVWVSEQSHLPACRSCSCRDWPKHRQSCMK